MQSTGKQKDGERAPRGFVHAGVSFYRLSRWLRKGLCLSR